MDRDIYDEVLENLTLICEHLEPRIAVNLNDLFPSEMTNFSSSLKTFFTIISNSKSSIVVYDNNIFHNFERISDMIASINCFESSCNDDLYNEIINIAEYFKKGDDQWNRTVPLGKIMEEVFDRSIYDDTNLNDDSTDDLLYNKIADIVKDIFANGNLHEDAYIEKNAIDIVNSSNVENPKLHTELLIKRFREIQDASAITKDEKVSFSDYLKNEILAIYDELKQEKQNNTLWHIIVTILLKIKQFFRQSFRCHLSLINLLFTYIKNIEILLFTDKDRNKLYRI